MEVGIFVLPNYSSTPSLTRTGHVFPGATLPFGMAKAVADVGSENQGGFSSEAVTIGGFSHMHDSGTGGVSLIKVSLPSLPFRSLIISLEIVDIQWR
jgi:putative alpha-1,2-mannosidase